jgi:hypothetical protein
MSNTNPENICRSAEVEHLSKLEAIVQLGLDAKVEVGIGLAEISDARLYRGTHQTFAAYLRDRWGISRRRGHQLIQAAEVTHAPSTGVDNPAPATEAQAPAREAVRRDGPEALANVWEQARQQLSGDDVTVVDIRLTVRRRQPPAELMPEPWPNPGRPAELEAGELLPRLRWLLTQSSGTVAAVAHQLETRAADVDDDARQQLQDDVLVIDEELATLKAMLVAPVDWDAEYERLLADEIPPFDDNADDTNDE